MPDFAKNIFRKRLLAIAPRLLFKLQHYKLHKQFGNHAYWADLSQPKTFNEHILASKLDESLCQVGRQVVDKFNVKQYVADAVGVERIIPTLGIFDRLEDLIAADLCAPYVIKPTHLSGQVIFNMRKGGALENAERLKISSWLRRNHYLSSGEPQYRDLDPRIIVEPYIGTDDGPPNDYKFFCWHGKPRLIQVDTSRFQGHRRNFFDIDWNPLDLQLRYPASSQTINQPGSFPEMLEMAETLSAGFSFVRVDLYEHDQQVLFGEMTFHPDSGNAPFGHYESDLELGRFFARVD